MGTDRIVFPAQSEIALERLNPGIRGGIAKQYGIVRLEMAKGVVPSELDRCIRPESFRDLLDFGEQCYLTIVGLALEYEGGRKGGIHFCSSRTVLNLIHLTSVKVFGQRDGLVRHLLKGFEGGVADNYVQSFADRQELGPKQTNHWLTFECVCGRLRSPHTKKEKE